MKKVKDEKLFKMIRDYLVVYLPEQKCCSNDTVKSYREALNILLDYITGEKHIQLEDITFSLFNYQMIEGLLDWLEKTRNCSIATRNHRLSCIRSFFKYAGNMDPAVLAHRNDLQKIPLKKDMKLQVIDFMSEEALKAVLAQPDAETRNGVRDLFFMILMYDTAARDSELLDLKVKDISANSKTPCVYLTGKGRKKRVVPVMQKTVEHFYRYMGIFHGVQGCDPNQYLFYITRHGIKQQMSDDNVARFMNKYGMAAKAVCKEVPLKVHPHMFRRTRAMHLYRAGMPLALLSEWLGHENPETTLIYYGKKNIMERKLADSRV
jgi:integrase/recombinase XerD